MRRKLLSIAAVLVLIAVGYYAFWVAHTGPLAHAATLPQKAPAEATPKWQPKPLVRTKAKIYAGPAFVPEKKYPPGTYTPAGFAEDYRQRVVHEFSHFMSTRLGHELDDEREKQVAAVQNKFWDSHGPDVDLLREGKISQPEFAERSHQTMITFASDMEKIFTDDEYQKIFDVPKGTDTYYVLVHSPQEQPGMQFQPERPAPPNLSVLPTPHPTQASETNDPPPPPTNDKFAKAQK